MGELLFLEHSFCSCCNSISMVDGGVDGETSPISSSRDIPNHVISKVRDEEVERVP